MGCPGYDSKLSFIIMAKMKEAWQYLKENNLLLYAKNNFKIIQNSEKRGIDWLLNHLKQQYLRGNKFIKVNDIKNIAKKETGITYYSAYVSILKCQGIFLKYVTKGYTNRISHKVTLTDQGKYYVGLKEAPNSEVQTLNDKYPFTAFWDHCNEQEKQQICEEYEMSLHEIEKIVEEVKSGTKGETDQQIETNSGFVSEES